MEFGELKAFVTVAAEQLLAGRDQTLSNSAGGEPSYPPP